MAPNKFEKHIKKQLEEREIRPSSEAWSTLGKRLDETTMSQPKKKGYFWYAVAACLVGLIILSVVFFSTSTSISESNIQLVEEDKEPVEELNDFQKSGTRQNTIGIVSTEKIVEEKSESSPVREDRVVQEEEGFNEQLVDAPKDVQVTLKDSSEEIINTKVLQVLAQVDVLEQDSDALTDAEVDSLLRKAQEEILRDKLFRNDRSVDAMALLSEVENELDKSFRDQIFESLKNGFLKVRTAVADRNN